MAALLATGRSFSQSGTAATYSLEQCVQIATDQNLNVKQAEWQAQTDKAYWQQARAGMMPLLNTDISHGINTGRNIDPFTNTYNTQTIAYGNYALNTSITLWNGGAVRKSIAQNRLTWEADQMDLQQTRENITINVILAYLQVLNNRELLALADSQARVSRQQVERLAVMNREGAVSPYQYEDLKAQLANDNIGAANALNALVSARVSLFQLMNIPYNEQASFLAVDSTAEQIAEPAAPIYATAVETLPMVKAATLRNQAAMARLSAAKAARLPRLYLSGALGTTYSSAAATARFTGSTDVASGDYVSLNGNKLPVYTVQNSYVSSRIPYTSQFTNNFYSGIGIGISIPLLNAASARTQVRLAEVATRQAAFTENTTKVQLSSQVQQAHVNYTTALMRYRELQLQVSAYTESFRSAEIRFNNGVINSVDYLVAKNNLDRSRGNAIACKYDVLLRSKILAYYSGRKLF